MNSKQRQLLSLYLGKSPPTYVSTFPILEKEGRTLYAAEEEKGTGGSEDPGNPEPSVEAARSWYVVLRS